MHAHRVQPPMLSGLDWLALEAKDLESAREFYAERLGLAIREQRPDELVFAAGETDLVCRRPDALPRGGLHTHYAFSIPDGEYDDWWARLAAAYDLEEAQFGSARSLYLYDPDGNCVELGQRDVTGPGIDGIFEVVLEVERLERAREFYEDLGFEAVDAGDDRKRVRLRGPMALELWEPHLGIADARGGVHVDLGFETAAPEAALDSVADRVRSLERASDDAVVVRDPDGHFLTFTSA
ncbi:Glyoxalase/bleomycin resistance protein/dioxygenase [Natrinema pallidum DSM 3751]|uniref:Glyoxalase/bleomycin resistance protein/dioxygenase n=2 Tax=Natrinema pallidum TaxID=69527 RepID=L9YSS3_9EURY|nr:Glyoxalase/bleomycin resistance protein/dioxygenase [Natrinema pallidum DSM 3751]